MGAIYGSGSAETRKDMRLRKKSVVCVKPKLDVSAGIATMGA